MLLLHIATYFLSRESPETVVMDRGTWQSPE